MTKSRALLFLGLSAILLSGCGSFREDLGMGRNPPDEFAVMERPPLSLPPDFSLRPPRPGAPRPQTVDPTQQASASVFSGGGALTAATPSSGERALLAATGAAKTDPSIRDQVDRESAQKVVASPHLVERLLDWHDDQKPAATVDAAAEAERIKQAKDSNQPLNQGATPVIEKQQTGWLGL